MISYIDIVPTLHSISKHNNDKDRQIINSKLPKFTHCVHKVTFYFLSIYIRKEKEEKE